MTDLTDLLDLDDDDDLDVDDLDGNSIRHGGKTKEDRDERRRKRSKYFFYNILQGAFVRNRFLR